MNALVETLAAIAIGVYRVLGYPVRVIARWLS